ncbi:MAG: SDR family oxidoreductase [Candidatus Bathyarchaeota archaeon]|nr:SDR family oxidoreductase [Candidatus Bathyarchaeota archaeon]
MKGRLCIVTGANSGIGYHTALGLAQRDATVVLVTRDQMKGEAARDRIKEATGNTSVYNMHCDVSDSKSIDSFTKNFTDRFTCLHVLINNAGAAYSKRQTTEEGYEKTLATNYLGPFRLTHNLLPMLRQKTPSRIINIGSGMHKTGKIEWDDLQSEKKYKSMHAYATTKLMLTAYTYALAERLQGTGITANIVEPGFVATNLGANMGGFWDKLSFKLVRPMQISAEQGAETSIWAATDPTLEETTGKAFAKKKETKTAENTYDKEIQDRLWEETLKLLELKKTA